MPKKHQQKAFFTKPTSGASSSLSSSRALFGNKHQSDRKTVNDLIQESRLAQSNVKRPHNSQTSSSVPPIIRAVLDIPIPSPPLPRIRSHRHDRLRRAAGPPPPLSWLRNDTHLALHATNNGHDTANLRTRTVEQYTTLPGAVLPPSWSLQHSTMRSMAIRWPWHAEHDYPYLAQLPVRLREILLSYIAMYSDGCGPDPLHALFLSDTNSDDHDQVQRLDLGNAVGSCSTVKRIERKFYVMTERADLHALSSDLCNESHETPETWEDEECSQGMDVPSPVLGIASRSRFRNLKHLSLAISPEAPRSSASWQDLLSLASKLPTLISLSLAFWPPPTYTPNASTGMFKVSTPRDGSRPNVVYGGSNFYTAFDNDWREAAGILRSLSRNLYCLEWLDLTGCSDWASALTWRPDDCDEGSFILSGPDWNGSWRGLDHIILAVGWLPGNSLAQYTNSEASDMLSADEKGVGGSTTLMAERTTEMLSRLAALRLGKQRRSSVSKPETWDNERERAEYRYRKQVDGYMECLNCVKETAQKLRVIRRAFGGKWLNVDLGPAEELPELVDDVE